METTYIENAQDLIQLRPTRSDAFLGRTRKVLLQTAVALCLSSNCGLNVARGSSTARYCWQKKTSDVNTPSEIFDFKAKIAETIRLLPWMIASNTWSALEHSLANSTNELSSIVSC